MLLPRRIYLFLWLLTIQVIGLGDLMVKKVDGVKITRIKKLVRPSTVVVFQQTATVPLKATKVARNTYTTNATLKVVDLLNRNITVINTASIEIFQTKTITSPSTPTLITHVSVMISTATNILTNYATIVQPVTLEGDLTTLIAYSNTTLNFTTGNVSTTTVNLVAISTINHTNVVVQVATVNSYNSITLDHHSTMSLSERKIINSTFDKTLRETVEYTASILQPVTIYSVNTLSEYAILTKASYLIESVDNPVTIWHTTHHTHNHTLLDASSFTERQIYTATHTKSLTQVSVSVHTNDVTLTSVVNFVQTITNENIIVHSVTTKQNQYLTATQTHQETIDKTVVKTVNETVSLVELKQEFVSIDHFELLTKKTTHEHTNHVTNTKTVSNFITVPSDATTTISLSEYSDHLSSLYITSNITDIQVYLITTVMTHDHFHTLIEKVTHNQVISVLATASATASVTASATATAITIATSTQIIPSSIPILGTDLTRSIRYPYTIEKNNSWMETVTVNHTALHLGDKVNQNQNYQQNVASIITVTMSYDANAASPNNHAAISNTTIISYTYAPTPQISIQSNYITFVKNADVLATYTSTTIMIEPTTITINRDNHHSIVKTLIITQSVQQPPIAATPQTPHSFEYTQLDSNTKKGNDNSSSHLSMTATHSYGDYFADSFERTTTMLDEATTVLEVVNIIETIVRI